jgi:hypothetical protein
MTLEQRALHPLASPLFRKLFLYHVFALDYIHSGVNQIWTAAGLRRPGPGPGSSSAFCFQLAIAANHSGSQNLGGRSHIVMLTPNSFGICTPKEAHKC